MRAISEGTLLAVVDPAGVDEALAALEAAGIPAADAGEVTDGTGLVVDGDATEYPDVNPFWAAFEASLGTEN